VRLSPAETAARGLPALELKLDTGNMGMSGSTFSGSDEYFGLSGPPGGPLGVRARVVRAAPADPAGWKAWGEKEFKDRLFVYGSFSDVQLNDKSHKAFTFMTGRENALAENLVIVFPVPSSKDAVIVHYDHRGSAKPPTPQAMIAQPRVATMLRTLLVRFP